MRITDDLEKLGEPEVRQRLRKGGLGQPGSEDVSFAQEWLRGKERKREYAHKLSEYRQHLVLAEQKSQEDYDKTIITLSGGALAISFAFLKDYLGKGLIENVILLLLSWISWGLSVAIILASFYFSHLALRKTIKQVDDDKIKIENPGGALSAITAWLNSIGGLLFFIGVIFMIWFTTVNLSNRRVENGKNTPAAAASEAHSTAPKADAPKAQ